MFNHIIPYHKSVYIVYVLNILPFIKINIVLKKNTFEYNIAKKHIIVYIVHHTEFDFFKNLKWISEHL